MARVLIYLIRRDIRLTDNPIFNEISAAFQQGNHEHTHLLPVYVFAAQQVEVSGFLNADVAQSPFPEAKSRVASFWRCGPHRAKFLAESVWDLKHSLEEIGSGLEIRVGMVGQVLQDMLHALKQVDKDGKVISVWMTSEEGSEEQIEERRIRAVTEEAGSKFQLWPDEKYFIDE